MDWEIIRTNPANKTLANKTPANKLKVIMYLDDLPNKDGFSHTTEKISFADGIFTNNGKSYTISSSKINSNNYPIVYEFYKINPVKTPKSDKSQKTKIRRSIYTRANRDINWDINLIIEKTHKSKSSKASLENNDSIYMEFLFKSPQITKNDLIDLENEIKSIKKSGGDDTKTHIVNLINKFNNKPGVFKYLGDIFITPTLINRNTYFNEILLNLSKKTFCVGRSYIGIEFIIIIDSTKNIIYYATKTHVVNEAFTGSCGICVMSAIKYKGKFIIRRVFVENTLVIDKSVADINDRNKKFGSMLKFDFMTYEELTATNYQKKIKEFSKSIIEFIEIERPFFESTIYYWSSHKLPITFFCRECPAFEKAYPRIKGMRLYILFLTVSYYKQFTGIKKLPFHNELFGDIDGFSSPLHFSPSTFPNAFLFHSALELDKSYISLVFDIKTREWIFIEKVNKSDTNAYGDDFKNVELNVWNSYRNPVMVSDLIIDIKKINEQMYFINKKNPMHEAPIKMNNFVKRSFIKRGMTSVIDLASGRGSDLMNYRNAGVQNLLFCEIDVDAIDEVLERKYSINNSSNTHLSIFNADLNEKYKTNLATINGDFAFHKVSNIFCFFALHYMTTSPDNIKNITALIGSLLERGGEFLYTAFDGEAVIKLLAENKGKWEVFEKGAKKYSIMAKYKDTKTTKRPIKLILPFNANTFYYDENLINEKLLDAEFSKNGLKMEKEGSFMDFAGEFSKKRADFYKRITEDDKIFIGLYKYKIYKKIK